MEHVWLESQTDAEGKKEKEKKKNNLTEKCTPIQSFCCGVKS